MNAESVTAWRKSVQRGGKDRWRLSTFTSWAAVLRDAASLDYGQYWQCPVDCSSYISGKHDCNLLFTGVDFNAEENNADSPALAIPQTHLEIIG